MKKIAILFNPSSGKGRSFKERGKIENLLNGVDYDLFLSESEEDLKRLAREKSIEYPVIVGVGGDTTFNIIADAILDTCPPPLLGMIGTGSANDIVRGLGIHSIQEACTAIKTNLTKKMDVGFLTYNQQHNPDESKPRRLFFMGTISAGLGATVNQFVESFYQSHKLMAKMTALTQTPVGMLGMRHSFTSGKLPLNARVRYPGTQADIIEKDIRFSLLVFLNTPYYANGMNLVQGNPRDCLFDQLLDCCIINSDNFSNTLRIGSGVSSGKFRKRPEVSLLQSRFFTVIPQGPMDIQVDGEIIPAVTRMEISVQPGILKVLA